MWSPLKIGFYCRRASGRKFSRPHAVYAEFSIHLTATGNGKQPIDVHLRPTAAALNYQFNGSSLWVFFAVFCVD